jgi:SAM-dependent MidA family methyltransferase
LADIAVAVKFHAEPIAALTAHSGEIDGPAIVIGNEFLDTLPIEQLEFRDASWRARTIGCVDERLGFLSGVMSAAAPKLLPKDMQPEEGHILEVCVGHGVLAEALAAKSRSAPVAALFVDYGHMATGYGDTLQGVADQIFVSPFFAPGETDLSAHVDFEQFVEACRGAGLATDGPVTQSEFLGSLGIMERASRLMAANPAQAAAIEAGVARLMSPSGMGSRFKAIGIRSPGLPLLPGFASPANSG